MRIDYPSANRVSIWVGTFSDEDQMNECVDRTVEPSLHLQKPLSAICEVCFEDSALPLRQLLEGFSGWQYFIDQACHAGASMGVETANSALVCYYLHCEAPADAWRDITFLGSFEGRDVG